MEQVDKLISVLRTTPSLIRVLDTARALHLPDPLVFSGAVYQPVLNHLTGRAPDYGIKDYDLAYFDDADLSYEAEDAIITRVAAAFDEPLRYMVQVRNQARVHIWFESKFGEPYTRLSSTAEALERFARPYLRSAYASNPTAACTLRRLLASAICSRYACGLIHGARSMASLGSSPMLFGAGLSSSLTATGTDKRVFISLRIVG